MSTPNELLLAKLRAIQATREIKRHVVHVEEWNGLQRAMRPHLLIDGKLVRLTDEQIATLNNEG